MNNKENMQNTNSEYSHSNVDKDKAESSSQIGKSNANNNGIYQEYDNASNILTIKNANTVRNTSAKYISNSNYDAKQYVNNHNDLNTDLKNGNAILQSASNVSYRPNSTLQHEQNNITATNLRRSHMAKSNPQLHMASSYVDIHPLSNSLMDTSRDVPPVTIADRNLPNQNTVTLQVRHSQSSGQLNEDAVRRITEQFTPAQIPIVGYEVMEERARFTIYKLRIDDPRTGLSWMVFRRYTDFVRLYQKLKMGHRDLILPLPEKRLFRNNFDPSFLEERSRGLQLFVNAVVKKLSLDKSVREFFCLDEPPDVGDSEPEAQALFGALEDTVGGLKNQLKQQEETIKFLRQKVFYLEEKMKNCSTCNPLGQTACSTSRSQTGHSPLSSTSSNGS